MATRETVVFTLPLHCQICLDKVKQPVVCPNQHAFCSACMEEWLTINQQCPACRVPINTETPCKAVIGSLSSTVDAPTDALMRCQLRRTRLNLLMRDYETEISTLQSQVDELQEQNESLLKQLARHKEAHSAAFPTAGENNQEEAEAETTSPPAKRARCSCDGTTEQPNLSVLLKWTEHLETASKLYSTLKADFQVVQREKKQLQEESAALQRENSRLRQEQVLHSPQRLGRYTAAAQGKQIEQLERQVAQLNRALERSDQYIADLEQQLRRSQERLDSVPVKGCEGKWTTCGGKELSACSCAALCRGASKSRARSSNESHLRCIVSEQVQSQEAASSLPVQRVLNFHASTLEQSVSDPAEEPECHRLTDWSKVGERKSLCPPDVPSVMDQLEPIQQHLEERVLSSCEQTGGFCLQVSSSSVSHSSAASALMPLLSSQLAPESAITVHSNATTPAAERTGEEAHYGSIMTPSQPHSTAVSETAPASTAMTISTAISNT